MALANANRVKETTTTTGTGAYTLGGAATGFQSFSAGVGANNTCWYCATDNTNWEVGLGTVNGTATQLTRTTIYASSNAGAAVNWGAGTKDVFVTLPSSKAVDPGGPQTISGAWEFTDTSQPMGIGNASNKLKIGFIDSADITTGETTSLIGHSYDATLGYGNLYLRPRSNSSGLAVKIVSGFGGTVNELANFGHSLIEHKVTTRHHASLELRSQNQLFFYNAANTSNATMRLASFFDFDGNGASVRFFDANSVLYQIGGNFQMQDSDNGNANVFVISPGVSTFYNEVRSLSSASGYTAMVPGTATRTGMLEWRDAASVRQGYIGFGDGTTLNLVTEAGNDLTITLADQLVISGLPTTNPGGTNRLWNDGGTVKIT